MNLKFGAVNLGAVKNMDGFIHMQVTVSGEDQIPFQSVVKALEPAEKELAETVRDEWKFTLGIDPQRGETLRVLPGHDRFGRSGAFGAFAHPIAMPNSVLKPVVQNALQQVEAIGSNLKQWVG